jgi:hypothetical protein
MNIAEIESGFDTGEELIKKRKKERDRYYRTEYEEM